MAATEPLYAFADLDLDNPLYGIEAIREVNPQRFEMEQLTAIVHMDTDVHGIVGYKDITADEFWIRGHMPDFPLMPGVIQCEAAAQLAGFYARKSDLLGAGDFLGFGGMDGVRFKLPLEVGDRLVLMVKSIKVIKRRLAKFQFQGWKNEALAFSGEMIGVPIDSSRDTSGKPK